MFQEQNQLSQIAIQNPASIRVFRKYGLDFCCGGKRPLAEACAEKKLDTKTVLSEINAVTAKQEPAMRWDEAPVGTLIDHILERFHAKHRLDLETLLPLAKKVEAVHAGKPMLPKGLAALLATAGQEMESHMEKEETILFPWILEEGATPPYGPVQVMLTEHDSHAIRLAQLRAACHDFQLPEDACTSWRSLYRGVEELIADVMEHIHLENNVLFPLALNERK